VERPEALVIDAGPLYAYADRRDGAHSASLHLFETHPGPLIVPMLVIAEVTYLMRKHLNPAIEVALLADLADGHFAVEPVQPADWSRIAHLVARYRDFPLGTVDASVVACAERLGARTIATLDRRHFSVVRPAHVDAFELLPA